MPRVTITVPGKSPQPYRFQLDRRLLSIGRGSNSDIVIDSGSVSVTHAQMCRVEGGYEIRDFDSTNGIKLDGERVPVVPLRNGMVVYLGDVAFDFQLSEEEIQVLELEAPMQDSPILKEAAAEPELPALPPAPPQRVKVREPEHVATTGSGCGSLVWLFTLVILAFTVGMAIRYQRETGQSWLPAVFEKIRITKEGGASEPPKKSGDAASKNGPAAE